MRICPTIEEMRAASRSARHDERTIGFIPTMGALHEGHLSLVRVARSRSDIVVVSIFVNPTQFGPGEDYTKYPRTFAQDSEQLQKAGVDFIFAPSPEDMYPQGATTWVDVAGVSERLDGRSRPGHFRGVTTVVSKLFHIVEPSFAFFGQKDAAQVAVIRRMVRDLNFPLQIVVCPIVREADGLALSSRNIYLSPQERRSALALSRSLNAIRAQFQSGECNAENLIEVGKQVINEDSRVRLDYLEIVDPETLEPISTINRPALASVAAFVGTTRLIDNVLLYPAS